MGLVRYMYKTLNHHLKSVSTYYLIQPYIWEIQYNLNGSNPDGLFAVDDSNSFFQSLQNPSSSSRKQIFRDFFLILSRNCMLCVLIRIALLR